MTSLPPTLLDQLLNEISTLASVYHKPPSTFVGHGRYGADAIQHAAIQEQRQDAVDNPIAAAAITAAASAPNGQANAENLLDIDFDGAAPASADAPPSAGTSGLEGLGGTPAGSRVTSPTVTGPSKPPPSSMDDMMGLFDSNGTGAQSTGGGTGMGGMGMGGMADLTAMAGQDDIMNGFASLDMGGVSHPPPPQSQLQGDGSAKKTNEDLLGMF